jgi:RNA polymerase sigma factor (TIGR02999 family)
MPLRETPADDVTALLRAWRAGDAGARDRLLERVYADLKRIAAAQMRGERVGHTLEPTALVHESFLRLIGQAGVDWRDRAHFFGLAAAMMRRVLVDHARKKLARKRRADELPPTFPIATPAIAAVELLDLDRALDKLAQENERSARVVEMRYFAGLGVDEVAACLDISPATVGRDWEFARAWMSAELRPAP